MHHHTHARLNNVLLDRLKRIESILTVETNDIFHLFIFVQVLNPGLFHVQSVGPSSDSVPHQSLPSLKDSSIPERVSPTLLNPIETPPLHASSRRNSYHETIGSSEHLHMQKRQLSLGDFIMSHGFQNGRIAHKHEIPTDIATNEVHALENEQQWFLMRVLMSCVCCTLFRTALRLVLQDKSRAPHPGNDGAIGSHSSC